jgi:hypothetical protein
MKRPNEYEAVLQALTSTDLRSVSAQLQAVEDRSQDQRLRVYLRLAIGLLNSPILQDANQRGAAWSALESSSIKPLVEYCRARTSQPQ